MSFNTDISDIILQEQLSRGSREAFDLIYTRYWGLLYIHANKMLSDKDLAKDAVQDVFLSVWKNRSNLVINSSLSAYLYSATRNKVLNIIEKSKVYEKHLRSLEHYVSENTSYGCQMSYVHEKQLRETIERESGKLPERMRQVFELSRKLNLSHADIAFRMKISEHTVRKQVKNALRLIRHRISSFVYFF